MLAGVQFVSDTVIVVTADRAATPSNVAGVEAGAVVLLPDPLQPPETVKSLAHPFETSVL